MCICSPERYVPCTGKILAWSSQAFLWPYITAGPRLRAGLMPVPVIGMVAKWTMNTANPIGSGTKTYVRARKHHMLTQ